MRTVQIATDFVEDADRSAGIGFDAEHLAEDCDTDLKAYSGEEADENSLGEEVGDEAELEQTRKQQKSGGEERDETGQRYISCAGGRGHAGESAAKNGGGG